MLENLYCPRCMAPVLSGDRFCGNCGANLIWAVRPAPSAGTVTPLGKEISKLLVDFEQRLKCNPPG
jgi:predicted amidophosphoribosyltransferase